MTRGLIPRRDDLFFPVEQAFDRFFQDFFQDNSLSRTKSNSGYPKMNAVSTDDSLVLTFAVPGMGIEDLDVELSPDNVLTVRGQMSDEHKLENGNYHIKELRSSRFERSVTLPEGLLGDPDTSLQNGILKLSWKKTLPTKQELVKKIAIKNGKDLLS